MIRARPAPAYRLFGLIAAREQIELPPQCGARLELFQELAAVVAEQPSGGTPPPLAVETHRAIVASVFAHSTILPSPPGIIFQSISILRRWLELHHAALLDGLAYVDGRAEARVHVRRVPVAATDRAVPAVSADRDRDAAALDCVASEIFHELGREHAAWVASPALWGAGSGANDGAASAAPRAATASSEAVSGANSGPVASVRRAAPRTRDDGDVSASFLVDRSRWRAVVDAVAVERQRAPELDIRVTGPWPPYDFVRLQFGG